MDRLLTFTPKEALAWAFRPRLWMGLAPLDAERGGQPGWWSGLLFNEGPAIFDVDLDGVLAGGATLHHRLDILAEGNAGYVFLGGPVAAPPEAVFTVRARTADGTRMEAAFRCAGLRRPVLLPPRVASQPVLPLAPGLGWPASEYVPVLRQLPGLEPTAATPLQRAWLDAAWRWLHEALGSPTRAVAREIAWAATAAVFGARGEDRRNSAVADTLEALSFLLQTHAEDHAAASRPARDLPRRRLALALVPGAPPVLHLLNPGPRALCLEVRVERYRWGRHAAALAPEQGPPIALPPRSAVAVATLRPWDPGQELECRVILLGPKGRPTSTLHALYPAGTTLDETAAIPVALLGGRAAHVRWMEAALLPPGREAA